MFSTSCFIFGSRYVKTIGISKKDRIVKNILRKLCQIISKAIQDSKNKYPRELARYSESIKDVSCLKLFSHIVKN